MSRTDGVSTEGGKKQPNVRQRELIPRNADTKGLFHKRGPEHALWKPPALRFSGLLSMVIVSCALIALLQAFLMKSQKDGGLIFAKEVNDLPLQQTFAYLYLPTILAVFYSLWWTWIDLDAKRLEPFHQLSKPGGTSGENSLLLRYPFDFIATVPLAALKRRHMPVFWASTAIVVIFWGLTPSQAGLFATTTIKKTVTESMIVSEGLVSSSVALSSNFAYSVYNILTLNETLPSYMSEDYFTVSAFKPNNSDTNGGSYLTSETWTTSTTAYTVDVTCEEANVTVLADPMYASTANISNSVCSTDQYLGPDGNDTVGLEGAKTFSPAVVNWDDEQGIMDWWLGGICQAGARANVTFFTAFTRNKRSESDPPMSPTRLFCKTNYYSQAVNATVAPGKMSVSNLVPIGPRTPMPIRMFNSTLFERQASGGTEDDAMARGMSPTIGWPNMPLPEDVSFKFNDTSGIGLLGYMFAMHTGPLEDLLDPKVLAGAWQSAYRLLFGRAMADLLSQNYTESAVVPGQRHFETQAVVMVPTFTYIVEALLAIATCVAAVLAFLIRRRPYKLTYDPATVTGMMSLVADDPTLLNHFAGLEFADEKKFELTIKDAHFELINGTGHSST